MEATKPKKKSFIFNILFVAVSGAILLFLLRAPDETTPFLPHDEIHTPFHEIKSKKEAEKNCLDCHGPGKEAPLQEGHPPKYRCLFCHKR